MRRYVSLLAVMLLAWGSVVEAQQPPKTNGSRHSQAVSALVDKSTLLIVHVDLKKLDLDAAAKWAFDVAGVPEADRAKFEEQTAEPREAILGLKAAGATDVYVVVGTGTVLLGGPPAIVVSTAKGKAKDVANHIRENPGPPPGGLEIEAVDDAVLIATEERIKEYKDAKRTASAGLAKVFDAAGDTTVQAIVVLSDDVKAIIREKSPPLPPEVGDVTVEDLTDWLRYVIVSINAPPKLKFNLVVQTKDAAAAKSLGDLVANLIDEASKNDDIAGVPGFDKLTRLLRPKVDKDRLMLTIPEKPEDVETIREVLAEGAKRAKDAAERIQHVNNFRMIGLAIHNYLDVHKRLPLQTSYSKDGKPLLSWRVQILPYLEQNGLYNQFHLDEPWDSEHNKKLVEKMPEVFANPRIKGLKPGQTTMLAPLGDKTMWSKKDGTRIADVTDGLSNTIMVVEGAADRAVIWTKPDDLKIDVKKPATGLFSDERKSFVALIADGSVRNLSMTAAADVLNALFTMNGGEPIADE